MPIEYCPCSWIISTGVVFTFGLGGWGWGAGAGGVGGLGHELRGSLTCLYRKLELYYKHEH